ncbi:MAG: hypothetical protein QQN63_10600, partial [Nitrosopumilus sp.]
TISRDGSSPNTMSADFDMNTNDILNAGAINAVTIVVNGTSLATQVTNAANSATASATSATASATSATAAAASADTATSLTVFTTLTDTPSNYSGDGNKFVKVNSGATALEFVAGSATEPSDGDKGDITVSGGSGLVWNIDNSAVDASALATDAVETAKIKDVNVTTAKIALNAVTLNLLQHGTTGDILYYGASGEPFRLAKGSDTQILTLSSGLPSWAAPVSADTFATQYLHVRDQQSSGSAGGTFTSGSWVKRTLNTVVSNEITSATLTSSVISLPAGTYYINARAPALDVKVHKLKLRNTSDSSDTIIGTSTASGASNTMTLATVVGRFTIAGTKNFELQHRCLDTTGTHGLGRAMTISGVIEVYAEVEIWKVA